MADEKISPSDAAKMVFPIDVDGIRAELAKILQVAKSADFIRELLKQASENAAPANRLVEGGDLLKVYDLVRSQKGFIRSGAPGSIGGGSFAIGSIATGDAKIQLGNFRPGLPVTADELKAQYLKSDTAKALHETIHHAGRLVYSDQDLAIVVSTMPGERPPLPTTGSRFDFSKYWDEELRKRCNIR